MKKIYIIKDKWGKRKAYFTSKEVAKEHLHLNENMFLCEWEEKPKIIHCDNQHRVVSALNKTNENSFHGHENKEEPSKERRIKRTKDCAFCDIAGYILENILNKVNNWEIIMPEKLDVENNDCDNK